MAIFFMMADELGSLLNKVSLGGGDDDVVAFDDGGISGGQSVRISA